MSVDLRRRARLFRWLRLGVLVLVVGYFFAPYDVQAVIPVWLLFALAVGLEIDFFVGGWWQARQGVERGPVDRGPQPRDIEELGPQYDEWEPISMFPSDWYSKPVAAARPYWRYVAEALGALAVVAVILYFAVRPSGWDAVSPENQAQAEAVFSREASRIAGHPATVGCDESGRQVGYVQHADGVAEVGGTRAYLTPGDLQHALPARVQGSSPVVLAHGASDRSPRPRGAAPRGMRNEGLANCYGFQSGVDIGVNLGLSESRARSMMREQLVTPPPSLEYRVPSDCRV